MAIGSNSFLRRTVSDTSSDSSEQLRESNLHGYGGGGGSVLPLPWNPAYKSAWQTFLTALASRYEVESNVSLLLLLRTTAASAEMILPRDGNTPNQTQFGAYRRMPCG